MWGAEARLRPSFNKKQRIKDSAGCVAAKSLQWPGLGSLGQRMDQQGATSCSSSFIVVQLVLVWNAWNASKPSLGFMDLAADLTDDDKKQPQDH